VRTDGAGRFPICEGYPSPKRASAYPAPLTPLLAEATAGPQLLHVGKTLHRRNRVARSSSSFDRSGFDFARCRSQERSNSEGSEGTPLSAQAAPARLASS
jgi:hypothetical protein